ncbi:unnamed protein product [Rotaria magnacalcarata]|uniref:Uncharacterized protein n=1 Tax=Rotaria magnacalcarata TaxID=392030 RepID=A0A816NBY2_9BILA|nr:unnamed protein product [Rotaria magnacalcarata]CAF2134352.1 unnamed protein product [Rotaria magnacalcarata]CAF2259405.1 unnamed protein product [Rotaria magnacalcarata]
MEVMSSADTEKQKLDQELKIAVEKLCANPADDNVIKEINNIHIKFTNLSKNFLNSETASTNFEPSNDAQLSSTNVEASTNDDSSEHGSRRLNDDNQNNSYFQMGKFLFKHLFQWLGSTQKHRKMD